jgi:PEP-CTERM motif-containing protein
MRKIITVFGLMFVVAVVLVQPAKADNFLTYQLTGNNGLNSTLNITFTLPQTFTPSSLSSATMMVFQNITGTLIGNGAYDFATVDIATSGVAGVTNYWAFGSQTQFVELVAPGLFTINPNGTVTLNTGTFEIGDYHVFQGGSGHDYTLTAIDPPGPKGNTSVVTPEPASLMLLGFGSLALAGIRRRKAA